jgi:hypothetical protein
VNTAVLAWYTGVLHVMKPVTSGYRLALSYNVIHTLPDMPLPMVSKYADGPCAKLRRVLCNWKEKSKRPRSPDYITYLLTHQYSEVDFRRGASLLKGADSQRMAFVCAATEGLDFKILLANAKYCVSKSVEGDYGWCHRYYNSDTDEGEYISISISNVVDLDGHVILDGNKSIWMKDDDCFLPKNALQGVCPDGENEYIGNVSLPIR